MPQNAQKCPKMSQNMCKNHQWSFFKTSIFGDFSTFMTHFRSFSAILGCWRGCKQAKNDQKWPNLTKNRKNHLHIAHITHQNAPKHPEVVVEKKGFPTFLDALPKIIYLEPSSGPFQISSWVILPVENTPKHPKTPQNTPKHPKTCTKTIRDHFWKNRLLAIFRPLWPIFGHFRLSWGFEGGCQQGRKWPKMTKNDQKRQKSYHNCPDNPEKSP